MVAFANPVRGPIAAKGAVHPAGGFAVTSTFAEHIASGRGGGIDIGNGTCGFDLLAVGRFRVEEAFVVTSGPFVGAKVVRYRVLDDPRHQIGIAHMDRIETAVGVTGPEGAVIGHAGSSGGVPCHLHMGDKPTWLAGQPIDELDWWPLLRQNGATEDDMVPIPAGQFKPLANVKTSTLVPANFRSDRLLAPNIIKLYPKDTAFVPVGSANDGAPAGGPTPTLWFYGPLYSDAVPQGVHYGWFHSSVLGPMLDTSPDCAAEVLKAVAPLEKKLKDINVISS